MPTSTSFGPMVRVVRSEHGLTQVEVAEQTGVDGPRLSRIENGHVRPTSSEVAALVRVLRLDAGEVLRAVEREWPMRPAPQDAQAEVAA